MGIRIVITDDHDLLRNGLAVFIKNCEDFELVAEGSSGIEAVNLCSQYQPDVLLVDLMMEGMNGITVIRLVRQNSPHTQIIALTSFAEEELVQEAIQAGAISYLLKNISTAELARAVRNAYAGQSTLSQEAAQALVNATHRPVLSHFELTEREREVLTLMVRGLTNIEIANQLTISASTVKKHVRNILAKMNISNRTEAVALALQHKLVPPTGVR